MAREEVFFGINIDTGQSIKTFGDLKRRTKELKAELDGLEVGSKRFNELQTEITRNQATIRRFNRSLRDTKSLATRVGQGMTNAFKKVGGVIAGAFAVNAIIDFTKRVSNITAEFEKLRAVLSNTLGSKSEADKAFKNIQDFASRTNFSVLELSNAFVKLTNQGFKPTMEELENLADLANSTGKDFDQLAEAIIDAQVGEFERLKEFGIRAKKEGDNVKFTFKGVEEQVKFTEKEIRKYILSLGDLQGVSGSTEKISQTLGGAISNLGDAFDSFLAGLGDADSLLGSVVRNFVNLSSSVLKFFTETEKGSDKLQKQRMELNLLAARITDTNIKESERLNLVKQLNSVYPDFLGNLDAEKATNEQIANRLKEVNKELINKIALQLQDEKLQEQLTEAAKLQNTLFEQEQEIRSELIELNEKYGLSINFVNTTLEEQIKQAKEGLDAQTEVIDNTKTGIVTTNAQGRANKDLTLSLITLKSAQEDVNNATEEANKLQKQRQDLINTIFGGKDPNKESEVVKQTSSEDETGDGTKDPTRQLINIDPKDSAIVQFQKQVNENLANLNKERLEKGKQAAESEIELERETRNRIQAIEKASAITRLEIAEGLLGSTIQLLSRDEEARKKNAGIIKALAIGEVLVNLQKQISYNNLNGSNPLFPANWFSGGLAGVTVAQGLNALAIAQAGASIATITSQKFQKGGIIQGASHAEGGVPVKMASGGMIEAEGGEAIINKKNTALFAPVLSAINSYGGNGDKFERGGIINNGLPNTVVPPSTVQNDILTRLENINLSPTVSVVEINEAQTRISEITNNSTL